MPLSAQRTKGLEEEGQLLHVDMEDIQREEEEVLQGSKVIQWGALEFLLSPSAVSSEL